MRWKQQDHRSPMKDPVETGGANLVLQKCPGGFLSAARMAMLVLREARRGLCYQWACCPYRC